MNAAVISLRRSVALWRTTAIAASVLAAVLAIGIVARETTRRSAPREYVAILQKDAASPAFEVTVNLDKQELTVRPVAARAPAGKSYELWIIDAKLGAPRSLGVIGEGAHAANLSAYEPAVVAERDLRRDGRAAGRFPRRQAIRAACVRWQTDPG